MEHAQAWERLDEWLDGELPPEASAELTRHLDACPACQREAAARRRLGESLFAPAPAEDPRAEAAFARRVMARIEEESVPFWQAWLGRALAPALAAGLAALLLSLGSVEPLDSWDAPEAAYASLSEAP